MFRGVLTREGRSSLATGGVLSLAAHLVLVTVALVPMFRGRPVSRAALDSAPPLVTLDEPDAVASIPATSPVPPDATAAPSPVAPAPQPAVRRPRRPAILKPPPIELTAAPAPATAPPAAAPRGGGQDLAATAIVAHPPSRPAPPPYVAPGVAAGLRTYDTFPRMPDPLRGRNVHYAVLADVCVSDRGHVNRVRISAPPGAAALEHALRDAIRTWRYRPLITNGAPSPFCHQVQMRYQLD